MATRKPKPDETDTPDGDADFKDEVKPDNTQVPVGRPDGKDGK